MKNQTATLRRAKDASFDWDAIRRRIDISIEAVDRNFKPGDDERDAILRERARVLARAPREDSFELEQIEVLEFLIAGERYAVESSYVRECLPLKELTPLPCTPAFVAGIINVRGRIVSVVDLKVLFDFSQSDLPDAARVVVVAAAGVEIGILADGLLGVRSIPESDVRRSLSTLTGIQAEYLKGVTSDKVAVLDVATVLADPRIIVREEVDA